MLDHIGFERVAEWATLGAVGSNLSPMFALWSASYRFARARGVDYWVQSVVESLFSVYRDGFKTPMMRIGEREFFLGSGVDPDGAAARGDRHRADARLEPRTQAVAVRPWVDRRRRCDDFDDRVRPVKAQR
jgi:hypothetical protein